MEKFEFLDMASNTLNGVANNIRSTRKNYTDEDEFYTDLLDALNSTIDELEKDYPNEVAEINKDLDSSEMWYDEIRSEALA